MWQVNTLPTVENNQYSLPMLGSVTVERLEPGQELEVLEFLAQRPIHTVAMASFIRDNGIVSSLSRGTFYGCRDLDGQLEGVALVGHATLLETASGRALQALAQVAQECPDTHMIMGEQKQVEEFWEYCSKAGQKLRLACRESLLELRWPIAVHEAVPDLHLATLNELELVMPLQGRLAFEESGVNPMEVDPEGFRKRCLRRIEQDRTWVFLEDGKLVFKADIISESAEVVYLEGIWLQEDKRGNGYGVRCLSELSRKLLGRSKSICLLVDQTNKPAQTCYKKCGFLFRASYETIFLSQKDRARMSVN